MKNSIITILIRPNFNNATKDNDMYIVCCEMIDKDGLVYMAGWYEGSHMTPQVRPRKGINGNSVNVRKKILVYSI